MGDRGNVFILNDAESGNGVYLYSHHGGTGLPLTVQAALCRRLRWDDDSYLARIIFDEMTKGRQGEETSFGIATYRPDNEHNIVVVDCERKMIGFAHPDTEPTCYWEVPFESYIGLSRGTLIEHFEEEKP